MPAIRVSKEDYERLAQMKGYLSFSKFITFLLDKAEQPVSEEPKTEYKKAKPKKKEPADPRFKDIRDVYFQEYKNNTGIDPQFGSVEGMHVKQIIKKLDKLNEKGGNIVEFFRIIMQNLPEFYKTKNIKIINGNFTDIIADIRSQRKPASKGWDNIRPEHDWRI